MCKFYDESNKIWGKLGSKDADNSLGRKILDLLLMHGSKIAQINDDTRVQITYHELWLKTVRAAQKLQKRGFKPHQVLGFMVKNSDDLLPIFLASICLACPIVPLHSLLSQEEIIEIFTKTKPSAIFSQPEDVTNEAMKKAKFSAQIFRFDEAIGESESVASLMVETGDENSFSPVDIDIENDIAGIFCSSGTTGPSKCVCVSFGHTVYNEPHKYESNSVILDILSIHWTVGIKVILDAIFSGAKRVIFEKIKTPTQELELTKKYKVNYLSVSPLDLVAYIKSEAIKDMDLSHVKGMSFHGGKMPFELVSQIKHHFPNVTLVSSYGLTEVGRISLCVHDDEKYVFGSRLDDGCIVKIVDSDENRCGPNISGEIRVRKKYSFPGYFNDPLATAAAVDNEGFFRTGDIGYFDEDGLLHIGDRQKNVINLFYFDVAMLPSEIEEILIKIPNIKEVCVVGIPITSGDSLPAAVVVRKPQSDLSQHDIYNVVAKKKEKFKAAKKYDKDIQTYLSDFPEDFRKIIEFF